MTRRSMAALGAVALSGACMIGASPKSFGPATGGAGVRVSVATWSRGTVTGELLAALDTALVLVSRTPGDSAARLVLVPLTAIRSASFRQVGVKIKDSHYASGDALADVRRVSRYPQGVSGELLKDLLVAYKQEQVSVLQP